MLVSLLITAFKATVRGRSYVLAFGTHRTKHDEFLESSDELLAMFSLGETQERILFLVAVDTLDCIEDRIPRRWLPTQHCKEQIIDQVKSYLLAA